MTDDFPIRTNCLYACVEKGMRKILNSDKLFTSHLFIFTLGTHSHSLTHTHTHTHTLCIFHQPQALGGMEYFGLSWTVHSRVIEKWLNLENIFVHFKPAPTALNLVLKPCSSLTQSPLAWLSFSRGSMPGPGRRWSYRDRDGKVPLCGGSFVSEWDKLMQTLQAAGFRFHMFTVDLRTLHLICSLRDSKYAELTGMTGRL